MLRAVIFDMDDTLLDWSKREGNWLELTQQHLGPIHAYLKDTGHQVPDLIGFAETYSDQSRRAWESIAAPEWNCPRQEDIFRATFRAFQLETERIDFGEVQKRFGWGPIPGVRAFDDVDEVLRGLRTAKLKMGLITNAAMPMWMRDTELKALGILSYLDVRLTAGDVGKFKPHPWPFRVALERLQVTPNEAVFVGDRVEDDVAGAHAVGMRAIWIRRGASQAEALFKPNATIGTLRELPKVLDAWYPGWR